MSLKQVSTEFWDDEQVVNNFTPEDKLFYLWCLTNKHLNISGCFKVSINQIKYELGYNEQSIELLLDRFEHKHNVIRYDTKTNELLLLNFYKYNWTQSPSIQQAIIKIQIKNELFAQYINSKLGQIYGNKDNAKSKQKKEKETKQESKPKPQNIVGEVIDYLNQKLGTIYNPKSRNNITYINARQNEGYSLQDFKDVIDFKYNEWFNNDTMRPYLRPSTLFSGKFDTYLTQSKFKTNSNNEQKDNGGYEYAN